MKPFFRLTAASVALCAAAPAAWSLTAEEAWEAWVSAAAAYGEDVTAADTSKSGDTLTASGVEVSMQLEEMMISGTLGDVTLTENGDGSVAIDMAEEFQLNMTVDPEYGEKVEAVIDMAVSGLQTTASDADGGGVSFAYMAPEITVALGDMMVDGAEMPLEFSVVISNTNGVYTIGEGDNAEMVSAFNAESLQIDFEGRDPEGTGSGSGSVTMADITSSSTGSGQMMFMAPEQLPAMLKAGASLQGSTSVGATTFEIDTEENGNSFAMSGSLDGGSGTVALDAERVNYAFTYNGLDVTASGSDIPLPEVTMGMEETTFNLVFPLAQSEEPKPFMLAMGLHDLTVADGLWNMIDPGTVLPRDPATLTFNVAGTGNWLVDIMDPEAMANPQGMPGELHTMSISDVRLSAAGAELTAEGSFTFDNSDLMTFGGMPAPDGTLNARLTGGNALLDNLVQMGLLPEDQAMGTRMMMGMFARPGDGEDTLVSEIEVSPDGSISANGQRIK